jgi:mono/diheme cytochrome c family protein
VRNTTGFLAATLVLTAGLAASARAQEDRPFEMSGPALYKTYCASCHGVDAKGQGPVAHALRYQPADLTQLAVRDRGRFDRQKVHRIIDGRDPVKGRGGPDMPLWGDAFRRAEEGYSDADAGDRIERLVEYLETLQPR